MTIEEFLRRAAIVTFTEPVPTGEGLNLRIALFPGDKEPRPIPFYRLVAKRKDAEGEVVALAPSSFHFAPGVSPLEAEYKFFQAAAGTARRVALSRDYGSWLEHAPFNATRAAYDTEVRDERRMRRFLGEALADVLAFEVDANISRDEMLDLLREQNGFGA